MAFVGRLWSSWSILWGLYESILSLWGSRLGLPGVDFRVLETILAARCRWWVSGKRLWSSRSQFWSLGFDFKYLGIVFIPPVFDFVPGGLVFYASDG